MTDIQLGLAPACGIGYAQISALAERLANDSRMREARDWRPLLEGLGAKLSTVPLERWDAPGAPTLAVRARSDFEVFLPPLQGSDYERLLLATALGHYLLHSAEGSRPARFERGRSDANQEALWFAMALLIPDEVFQLADHEGRLEDPVLASFLGVPVEFVPIKRRILARAGSAGPGL